MEKCESVSSPITKSGVRILRPSEFELLEAGAKKEPERMGSRGNFYHHDALANAARLEGLLFTGMRYVEAVRFQENPDWFDGKYVHLPVGSMLKKEAKQQERYVWLNPRGKEAVSKFLYAKLPTRQTWGENLKTWAKKGGLDPIGLCAKTTRKTWESWLAWTYRDKLEIIFLSQGHNAMTSLKHYLNLPFAGEEESIKKYTDGMF